MFKSVEQVRPLPRPRLVQAKDFSDYRAARRVPEARGSRGRWCSNLCSERVGKWQIGTRQDRIAIGRFLAGNRKIRRDSRERDQTLVGLANRLTRLSGSLRFDASSWSVGSIWGKSGPPSPSH